MGQLLGTQVGAAGRTAVARRHRVAAFEAGFAPRRD
jgi:hypothetical protein